TVTNTTVTPTVADGTANIVVQLNGDGLNPVASGAASGPMALLVGTNTINVIVTAQDAITVKTYVLSVVRAPNFSTNADLAGLALSAGPFNPTFDSSFTNSAANGAFSPTNSPATPTVADSTASIQVQMNSGSFSNVTSGAASGLLALNVGTNTLN